MLTRRHKLLKINKTRVSKDCVASPAGVFFEGWGGGVINIHVTLKKVRKQTKHSILNVKAYFCFAVILTQN